MPECTSGSADRATVVDALRERYAAGNRYVKTLHLRDEIDAKPASIGSHLSSLEDDGVLERYRKTSTGVVWRMTDALDQKGPETGVLPT